MKTLTISLPADRTHLGTAEIEGQTFIVLGKSDNGAALAHHNPSRDPLLPFGDTPIGTYRGAVVPPGLDAAGFGPGRRILLIPQAGDCVTAEQNGRRGIMCHGGDPNPAYTQWGGLRPTDGCVRFSNANMAAVIDLAGDDELTVEIQLLATINQVT